MFQESSKFIALPIIIVISVMIGLGGCTSSPSPHPENSDYDKIQKDSDKSMQDMKKQEENRGGDSGY